MSVVRDWYESLDAEVILLVDRLVSADAPSDTQLEEAVDLVASYTIDAIGFETDERERLEAAVAHLERRITEADPRHKFLRMHNDIKLAPRLLRFYAERENDTHQHRLLTGTEYAPDPMHVDFDVIYWLENPDFTGETIGDHFLAFANLITDLDGDPHGTECYAHLAIDPMTTVIYLMEPSGQPELIADDLDGLLARLEDAAP